MSFGIINVIIICVFLVASNNFGVSLALPPGKTNHHVKHCVWNYPAIFNFGDSNSDTGGIAALYGPVPPPNGETFFGGSAGRLCDGRLFIDFLAESLGLPFLSPYLDSVGSNFSHGANFATAGSTIRPQNNTYLDIQFAEYSNFYQKSQVFSKQGGVFAGLLPKEEYFSRALYTFDIGQNDITTGYRLNLTSEDIKAYIPGVIDQFTEVVKGVYGKGGRAFWIHNTGPLGCLAYMLERLQPAPAQIDKLGCASPLNEVSQYYNSKLKEAVVQLRKDMPLATITFVDMYSLKLNLISQAKSLGFEEPLVACCGNGGKYNFNSTTKCGNTDTVNGKEILIAKSCPNPLKRVIWDGIHYSEAANKWIFDQISKNPSYLDPPISLSRVCRQRRNH